MIDLGKSRYKQFSVNATYTSIMPRQPPYTCISCGMTTYDRKDMRRHLYGRKTACPMSKNPVALTNEIRDYILTNRVYHVPKPEPTIHQTIHNNNVINNMIVAMPTEEKLSKYIDYTKGSMSCVSSVMEERFHRRALKFRELRENGHRNDMRGLGQDDIMEMIDSVTTPNDVQQMNVVYEPKYDRLKTYERGKWEDRLLKNGCKTLLVFLQETILDDYEMYLVKKMYMPGPPTQSRAKAKERMCEYYRFLAAFDIEPYAEGKEDEDLLPREKPYGLCDSSGEVTYEIQDALLKLYTNTSNEMTRVEMNAIKKEVVDIIKKNSKRNLDELNQKLSTLFHMDDEFQKTLMDQ